MFLAALTGIAVLGALAWRLTPRDRRASLAPDSFRISEAGADRYPVELDDWIHRHGSEPAVIAAMRSADVLIMGNSRVMLGLTEPELGAFFRARGLRYYYLGFGYGETASFGEALIRRYDLHPRWVIVNVDGYFRVAMGPRARLVSESTRLQFWQERFEVAATLAILPWLHRWYPRLSADHETLLWRSRSTGAWVLRAALPAGTTFTDPAGQSPVEPSDEVMGTAEAFKRFCDRIGARLILTQAPATTPFDPRGAAERMAQRLGVPFCAPAMEGMQSYDGSHLTPESARVFTQAFFAALPQAVPELAEKPEPAPRPASP